MQIRNLIVLILICVSLSYAQDTTLVRPSGSIDGGSILHLDSEYLVSNTMEIGNPARQFLNIYSLGEDASPESIGTCCPLFNYYGPFAETITRGYHGDVLVQDQILYSTLNTATYHGSINPWQFIGPLEIVAFDLRNFDNIWKITIIDSLFEEGEEGQGGVDLTDYVLQGSVVSKDNFLIVAAGSWGVQIYELTENREPQFVVEIDVNADYAVVHREHLIIAYYRIIDGYYSDYWQLYDISDPSDPIFISETESAQYSVGDSRKLFFHQGYMYSQTYTDEEDEAEPEIVVFEIDNEDGFIEITRVNLPFNISNCRKKHNYCIDNGRFYNYHRQILDIYTLENPELPDLLNTVRIDTQLTFDMYVENDMLYMANELDEQILIYNLNPNEVKDNYIRNKKEEDFRLIASYPNPFNSTTTISYSLPTPMQAKLAIYNTRGQLVDVLVDRVVPAGAHSVVWEARDASAGVYLVFSPIII